MRRREMEASLTADEGAELNGLMQELESAEAVYIAPTTARLHHERRHLEARNGALQTLVRRKQALADHLREVLDEAASERRTIEEELSRILAEAAPPATSVHS